MSERDVMRQVKKLVKESDRLHVESIKILTRARDQINEAILLVGVEMLLRQRKKVTASLR